jgi:hypothetical protein
MAGGEIDNAEAAMTKRCPLVVPGTGRVGATMGDGAGHAPEGWDVIAAGGRSVHETGDSAHY